MMVVMMIFVVEALIHLPAALQPHDFELLVQVDDSAMLGSHRGAHLHLNSGVQAIQPCVVAVLEGDVLEAVGIEGATERKRVYNEAHQSELDDRKIWEVAGGAVARLLVFDHAVVEVFPFTEVLTQSTVGR
jgi:hypothetical protein